jgi:hypothetical protein
MEAAALLQVDPKLPAMQAQARVYLLGEEAHDLRH